MCWPIELAVQGLGFRPEETVFTAVAGVSPLPRSLCHLAMISGTGLLAFR